MERFLETATSIVALEREDQSFSNSACARDTYHGWFTLLRWNSLLMTNVFVAAALLAYLAWPMFAGQIYVADDLGEFHLPLRAFYSEQLVRGEAFDWCPDLYCGFYLTGEGQTGGYHPFHLLLYRSLPISLAFGLECWLSYPFMLIGMYLFMRRLALPRAAALFAGTAFAFGSFNLLHVVHPNAVAIVAHLPWLLWALELLLRSEVSNQRRFAFAGVALLTGSQFLHGYPQYVFHSLAIEAAYVLWRVFSKSVPHKFRLIEIARAAAAVSIGLLIGAVQLLPTIEALRQSTRSDLTVDFALQGSLNPLNLVQLLTPYLFVNRVVGNNTHELAMYLGAVPLVLAAYCCSRTLLNNNLRVLRTAAVIVAFVALLWAFGAFGPFAWFQANLPLLNSFRFPCRAIVVFQFTVSILAALGFAELLWAAKRRTDTSGANGVDRLWFLPAISFVVTIIGLILLNEYAAPLVLAAVGPVAIALAVLLLKYAAHGSRLAIALLVLFSGVDLGVYGFTSESLRRTAGLAEFIGSTSAPFGEPKTRVAMEVATRNYETRIGDRILLKGWKRVDGYAGLEPARRLNYQKPEVLQLAGAGWEFEPGHAPEWHNLANPRPRAWLVSQTVASYNPARDILKIDTYTCALVGQPIDLPISEPGETRVLQDRPGHIVLETKSESDQLLVVNERFHPGWRAAVGSQSCTVIRVNGDFMGVIVPSGTHEIALEFRPESLRFGRIASGFGLGLIVATLLWPVWTVRPRRRVP
jgi:hypothetical protein